MLYSRLKKERRTTSKFLSDRRYFSGTIMTGSLSYGWDGKGWRGRLKTVDPVVVRGIHGYQYGTSYRAKSRERNKYHISQIWTLFQCHQTDNLHAIPNIFRLKVTMAASAGIQTSKSGMKDWILSWSKKRRCIFFNRSDMTTIFVSLYDK